MPNVLYAIARTLPEGRVRGTVETVAGRTQTSYASRSRPVYSTQTSHVPYDVARTSDSGPGKISRIIDYVTRDMPEGRVKSTVGVVSSRVYSRIGPPESFKQTVDVPLEVYSSGQPRATSLYYRMAYERSRGLDTKRTERQLVGELGKSRHWWETYAQFEGGKSWKDVQVETPGLYLGLNLGTMRFQPEYNYLRYQQEQVKQMESSTSFIDTFIARLTTGGKAGSVKTIGKAFGVATLKFPFVQPGFYMAKDKASWLAQQEYPMQQRVRSGDIGGYLWSDVVMSPLMQEIYFYGAFRGIGVVAKYGAKSVARAVPSVLGKTSSFFPKSGTIGRLGGFGYKVSQTPTMKHFYQWGAKGYKLGYRLVPTAGRTVRKPFEKGVLEGESVIRHNIFGGGRHAERIWMSPETFRAGETALKSRFAEEAARHLTKMGDDVTETMRYSWKVKGVFRKKFIQTVHTRSASISDDTFKRFFIDLADEPYTITKYGGYTFETVAGHKKAFGLIDEPVFYGIGETPLKPSKGRFLTGMADDVPIFQFKEQSIGIVTPGTRASKVSSWAGKTLRTGRGLGDFSDIPMFTKMAEDPIMDTARAMQKAGETWTKRYSWKHPIKTLISSKTATQTVIPKTEITTMLIPEGKVGYGKVGLISQLTSPIVPATSMQPLFTISGMGISSIVSSKTGFGEMTLPKQDVRYGKGLVSPSIYITKPKQDFDNLFIPVVDVGQKQHQDVGLMMASLQKQEQIVVPITSTVPVKAFSDTLVAPVVSTSTVAPVIPFSFLPSLVGGGGTHGWDEGLFGKRYKFRKFKVTNILKEMGV